MTAMHAPPDDARDIWRTLGGLEEGQSAILARLDALQGEVRSCMGERCERMGSRIGALEKAWERIRAIGTLGALLAALVAALVAWEKLEARTAPAASRPAAVAPAQPAPPAGVQP